MNQNAVVNAVAIGCITAMSITALLVIKGDAKDIVIGAIGVIGGFLGGYAVAKAIS